jgi:hypothetical protein
MKVENDFKVDWIFFFSNEEKSGIGKGIYLEENTAWTLPDVDYTPYQNILSAVWPSLRHKSYNWGVLKVDVNNADTFYKDFTELSVTDPCSRPETIKCGITGNTNCALCSVLQIFKIYFYYF